MSGAASSFSSNPLNSVSPESSQPLVDKWQTITKERVGLVGGIVARHLEKNWERDVVSSIEPSTVLPFTTPILPANEAVLAWAIPGYVPPTPELLEELTEYAKATENYGTAPGEAAALIVQIVRALKPETAFVFGTARGRLEHLIATEGENTEVVTIDLPTELLDVARGKPDSNNIRYRVNIGVATDEQIGDIFRADPATAGRVHQILGDSFTLSLGSLAGTMRLVVVDGNHSLPNSLMDLANAIGLIHPDGGIIVVDDFKKGSPLNLGVDAAVVLTNQMTGLPVLWPCPRPKEAGLQACAAVIVVPPELNRSQARDLLAGRAEAFLLDEKGRENLWDRAARS